MGRQRPDLKRWRVLWGGTLLVLACAGSSTKRFMMEGVRPEIIRWSPNPAVAAGAELAVLHGVPSAAGPYTVRLRFPADHRVMPHAHPDDRSYTVIEGTFYIGFGEEFDAARLVEYSAGSFLLVPGGSVHFQWARSGGNVVQVTGRGPTATTYTHPGDDPRD